MPVEILKASVGDYSVNMGKRGVTVNQRYLGAPGDWGPALPVHQWYLKNPKATVAEVAEQLDKLPKVIEVKGYKVSLSHGYLRVSMPGDNEVFLVSQYKDGRGDHVIQYLRKHYNGSQCTDVAKCAQLIRDYLNPKEVVVEGYKVYIDHLRDLVVVDEQGFLCNPSDQKTRVHPGTDCPVIAYLRTVMTKDTTVRETAKLIEDFLNREQIEEYEEPKALGKPELFVDHVKVYRNGWRVSSWAGYHVAWKPSEYHCVGFRSLESAEEFLATKVG